MKKVLCLVLLVFLPFTILRSQSLSIGGIFPTIDHLGKISKRLDYSFYFFGAFPLMNFKAPDFSKDANFLLLYSEQALTVNVNKQFSITGSYVYQREQVLSSNFVNENRIHIQAGYKHLLNQIGIKHRLRFDNRFVQNRSTDETPYTHRLRYLLGVDMAIRSKKSNLYLVAYEEVFFNTFRKASKIYAENWAFAGVGLKVNNKNKLEAGPLYITWNTGGQNWFHQYYLQLVWVSQLDFTRPEKSD